MHKISTTNFAYFRLQRVLWRLMPLVISLFMASCTIMERTHNNSVKQPVLRQDGDSSVVVQAGSIYKAGEFKRFMLGDHYREVWLAPVEVPILDLDTAMGGLTIEDKGGGMQTHSLKLKAKNGHLYSLRSIQKDPSPTLPFPLRFSFADDLVQDQISASIPYGAFILPPLGDAVGIYHTNPKLVYIPDTPALGKYRKNYGGMLAMLEEDADEDWSDYEDFGNTENAVSTETVREELKKDNDHYVDQKNFLRARLFDIWIGDWDRHGGQFRWAELDTGKGKFYRPIPEDRDNMFFKFDGFIPWWASRKWALRKFQDFQPDIRDMAGFNFNARHLDRRFLTGLSKEEWAEVAEDMQRKLPDAVIEAAIKQLPDTVYKITGPRLINILKARRNNLKRLALEYYMILAKQVDILGSDKSEYFEAIRKPRGTLEVNVYEASDEGEKKHRFYHRVFYDSETEEVRLYGRGGDDYFYVSGEAKESPLLRVVGGDGEDTFMDSSRVHGPGRRSVYYDNKKDENEIEEGTEAKVKEEDDEGINSYNYEGFEYDYFGPTLYFGVNNDDGLFLGGGVIITTQGFRKKPYATRHRVVANFAPGTAAWNFEYNGDFVKLIGDLGLDIDLLVRAPNYFSNFYGYGNETKVNLTDDSRFYRVRYQEVQFNPGLKLSLSDHTEVKFGPAYEYAKVNNDRERFIDIIAPSLNPDIFKPSHFAGFMFRADVNTTENKNKPDKGIRWITEMKWLGELNHDNSKLSRIESAFSVYYTVDIPLKTTFAVRIGGSSISGDFNFYQASTIGGNAGLSRLGNVRGYSRDRFSGRSNIYQNNEIRIRLLRIPFYYMPFEFGISAHFDQGRVWIEGENSDRWHTGVGGGFWIAPLGKWVFTGTYTHGEESIYNLNLGFLF